MTVFWVLLVAVLIGFGVYFEHEFKMKMDMLGKDWKMVEPMKKGGSFSIYYMDKHIANVRGKMKALTLIHAIKGIDITDSLDMKMSKVDKKVVKKVMDKKKKVVKKKVTKKVKK